MSTLEQLLQDIEQLRAISRAWDRLHVLMEAEKGIKLSDALLRIYQEAKLKRDAAGGT